MVMRCLALETSTQRMSVGVMCAAADGTTQYQLHEACGGAHASHGLLPAIQTLLQQAQCRLSALDALVVGRGPGAFTGLRTACAVAQGLAYGVRSSQRPHGLPVLVVDTLLALAEDARQAWVSPEHHHPLWITAVLDARMGEVYAATYRFDQPQMAYGVIEGEAMLLAPEDLALVCPTSLPTTQHLWAGPVWADAMLMARMPLSVQTAPVRWTAWPSAAALLRLAPALWQTGAAVCAADVQPLYVRNKVAQTTAERATAAQVSVGGVVAPNIGATA